VHGATEPERWLSGDRVKVVKTIFLWIQGGFWLFIAFGLSLVIFQSFERPILLSVCSLFLGFLITWLIRYVKQRKFEKEFGYNLDINPRSHPVKNGFLFQVVMIAGVASLLVKIANDFSYSDTGYIKNMKVVNTHYSNGLTYMVLEDDDNSFRYPIPHSLDSAHIIDMELQVEVRRGLLGLMAIKRVSLLKAN